MTHDYTVLQTVQQLTNWGILITDAQLRVTACNAWLEARSGRQAQAVIGRNLVDVFPELVARNFEKFYRQVLEGRAVLLSQRLHGHLLSMPSTVKGDRSPHMRQSAKIAPLVEEGQIVGTLTVIEDVTERVLFEEESAANARQHANLALLGVRALAGNSLSSFLDEAANVIATTLDITFCGVFEFFPDEQSLALRAGAGWLTEHEAATLPAGPNILGNSILSSAEPNIIADLTRETWDDPPELLQRHGIRSGISISMRSGERFFGALGVYAAERRKFRSDETHFLGTAANLLGFAIERARLEDALRNRVEQLALADQRKNEFLAMLAHELRNPLAPIQNAVQILRLTGPVESELEWARDVIERQVRQMGRLVDDLLDVSRITSGRINLQKEPVELTAIFDQALEISRPIIDAHRHKLNVSLPPLPLAVNADSTRLSQAVANIVNNAAKYTQDGGQIWLTGARDAADVVIRVRDTGVGITPEMLSSVFDLFCQADQSLARCEGGLGIGLTLVRNLVEMHGGTVNAFSEGPGRGSEFVIRLPAAPGLQPHATAPPLGNLSSGVAAQRILVVDDNVDCANSLGMLLRISGHSVETAYCGSRALELAARTPPNIVFLDIGLPGMNGYEVARRLRQIDRRKDLLLVAVSGYGQDGDRRQSNEAGFDHHLVKPVSLERLNELFGGIPVRADA